MDSGGEKKKLRKRIMVSAGRALMQSKNTKVNKGRA